MNAFLSTHTVDQAISNIEAIKSTLCKHLPGGLSNIKSMYLKSTDSIAVPIFVDTNLAAVNELKLENNMTPRLIKKAKKLVVKRLEKAKKAKNASDKGAKTKGSRATRTLVARKVNNEKKKAEQVRKNLKLD